MPACRTVFGVRSATRRQNVRVFKSGEDVLGVDGGKAECRI